MAFTGRTILMTFLLYSGSEGNPYFHLFGLLPPPGYIPHQRPAKPFLPPTNPSVPAVDPILRRHPADPYPSQPPVDPYPPPNGVDTIPPTIPAGSYPPPNGGDPIPPKSPADTYPPLYGADTIPSDTYPPPNGADTIPPSSPPDQYPPSNGADTIPPSNPSGQYPPANGVDTIPPPSPSGPYPPLNGADTIPPPSPVDPYPPANGADIIPPQIPSDPYPPPNGADTIPPQIPSDPYPPPTGADTIPPQIPSDPYPQPNGADTIPPQIPSDPYPPLHGADTIPPQFPSDSYPPPNGADTVPSASPVDPYIPTNGVDTIPPPSPVGPYPPLNGADTIPPSSPVDPYPPQNGADTIPQQFPSDPYSPPNGADTIPPPSPIDPYPPQNGPDTIPPQVPSDPYPPPHGVDTVPPKIPVDSHPPLNPPPGMVQYLSQNGNQPSGNKLTITHTNGSDISVSGVYDTPPGFKEPLNDWVFHYSPDKVDPNLGRLSPAQTLSGTYQGKQFPGHTGTPGKQAAKITIEEIGKMLISSLTNEFPNTKTMTYDQGGLSPMSNFPKGTQVNNTITSKDPATKPSTQAVSKISINQSGDAPVNGQLVSLLLSQWTSPIRPHSQNQSANNSLTTQTALPSKPVDIDSSTPVDQPKTRPSVTKQPSQYSNYSREKNVAGQHNAISNNNNYDSRYYAKGISHATATPVEMTRPTQRISGIKGKDQLVSLHLPQWSASIQTQTQSHSAANTKSAQRTLLSKPSYVHYVRTVSKQHIKQGVANARQVSMIPTYRYSNYYGNTTSQRQGHVIPNNSYYGSRTYAKERPHVAGSSSMMTSPMKRTYSMTNKDIVQQPTHNIHNLRTITPKPFNFQNQLRMNNQLPVIYTPSSSLSRQAIYTNSENQHQQISAQQEAHTAPQQSIYDTRKTQNQPNSAQQGTQTVARQAVHAIRKTQSQPISAQYGTRTVPQTMYPSREAQLQPIPIQHGTPTVPQQDIYASRETKRHPTSRQQSIPLVPRQSVYVTSETQRQPISTQQGTQLVSQQAMYIGRETQHQQSSAQQRSLPAPGQVMYSTRETQHQHSSTHLGTPARIVSSPLELLTQQTRTSSLAQSAQPLAPPLVPSQNIVIQWLELASRLQAARYLKCETIPGLLGLEIPSNYPVSCVGRCPFGTVCRNIGPIGFCCPVTVTDGMIRLLGYLARFGLLGNL